MRHICLLLWFWWLQCEIFKTIVFAALLHDVDIVRLVAWCKEWAISEKLFLLGLQHESLSAVSICTTSHSGLFLCSDSMDPDSGADTQQTLSLQWKSYKLVQDPALRRVTQKIYRYDGIHFSVQVWTYIIINEDCQTEHTYIHIRAYLCEVCVFCLFLGFRIPACGGLAWSKTPQNLV